MPACLLKHAGINSILKELLSEAKGNNMIKKVLAMPAVLLPISLVFVYAWRILVVSNTALDVSMNNAYAKGAQINMTGVKYWLPAMVSWLCHIILSYIKPPNKKWSWAHLTVSILGIFLLNNPFNNIPRRYYNYEIVSQFNIFEVNTATLSFCAWAFMLIQIMLWVYCLRAISKAKQTK